VGFVVARLGEPLRSAFKPAAWRALLAQHGFRVLGDRNLPELSRGFGAHVVRATRPLRHLRISIAEA
jgi:hypothetical protein